MAESERFERALLSAYFEAARWPGEDPSTRLLGSMGAFSHVVIEPATSPFATWLVDQQIAVVTKAGEVALPYGGSHQQTSRLAHALLIRAVRDVDATRTTPGDEPPAAHWEAMENLRERYGLPATVSPGQALPAQLLV